MEFRILKIVVGVFLMMMFTTSCTKAVKVKIPGYEEKIVIEGSIETDGFPFVLISKNKNVYAPTSQAEMLGSYLSGAKVWVSDGTTTIQLTEICTNNLPAGMDTTIASFLGLPVELLHQITICGYVGLDGSFKGEVGKTYSLKVEFEGETYEAASTILNPIPISNSYWKEEEKYPDYGYTYHVLQDPAVERNAYLFEVKRLNVDSTGEAKDKRYFKPYVAYFDDEFFNGISFEFFMDNSATYEDETIDKKFRGLFHRGDTLDLKFSNYEHSNFRFLNAILQQKLSGGSPFSLPTNAVGNISNGGLGIWLALSPSYSVMVCE